MFFRGQTIGKYRILSPLGSGGFGTVYLAEDTWIDKKVAIKVPHKQNLDFTQMLKEPRLLASLSHPNIVTILTVEKQPASTEATAGKPGSTDASARKRGSATATGRKRASMTVSPRTEDVFFIVMEYVPGETLEQMILREGALDVARALDFTCQICNAVDHAHRAGIIHRDLRPGNMLVSHSGLLKVSDFGTSRFLEIAAHGTTVIGSPPYMAPEQFQGKAVFASDIYSVGVTMYQMLTGVLPYGTPAPSDLDRLMRGELVSPPRLKNRAIPKAISDIVLRALSPDVTVRYQRATELLEEVLAQREPQARPKVLAGRTPAAGRHGPAYAAGSEVAEIKTRLKARETPQAKFCWHCSKPLQARTATCPFCGETQ
jgi:serine/threonine-protein kinase